MQKVKAFCSWCGTEFLKYPWELHDHNFCCFEHFRLWNSKRITEYNQTDNAMNKVGGVMESRIKRGNMQRGRGSGKSYIKYLGRHEHRIVAEKMIGRSLLPGEVVHHIDGNKRNNDPSNLMVLASQAEHARLHFKKGVIK